MQYVLRLQKVNEVVAVAMAVEEDDTAIYTLSLPWSPRQLRKARANRAVQPDVSAVCVHTSENYLSPLRASCLTPVCTMNSMSNLLR